MKPPLFVLSLLTLHFALLTAYAAPALATPHFALDPATNTNTTFTINLLIDTDNRPISSVDIMFDFNSQILEVTSINFGNLFPSVQPVINNTSGTLYLAAYFNDPLGSYSGTSAFATINMNGLSPGASPFNFRCTTGETNETNMYQSNPGQDIVDCSALVNGTYTVTSSSLSPTPTSAPNPTPTPSGTGSTPTSTPTPTRTPTPTGTRTPTPTPTWTSTPGGLTSTPTPTPTLTQLPETASLTPTLTLAILGATLILGSTLLLAL